MNENNTNFDYYEEDDVDYYENVTGSTLTGNLTWNYNSEHNYNYFNTYN